MNMQDFLNENLVPSLLSGTIRFWPGNMNVVARRFIFVNSEGVVSNRAATDVRVSRSRT